MREQFADIMRLLLTTAPHDRQVAEQLSGATRVYRGAFAPIAQRLLDLGTLRPDLDVEQAVDLPWFYFGYASLFTLHDDNGWSYESAERWLANQACQALLAVVRNSSQRPRSPS